MAPGRWKHAALFKPEDIEKFSRVVPNDEKQRDENIDRHQQRAIVYSVENVDQDDVCKDRYQQATAQQRGPPERKQDAAHHLHQRDERAVYLRVAEEIPREREAADVAH